MSQSPFPIFLLDIDSVLLEPRGYRLSIQAALNYFGERMGLADLYPGEEAIAGFEAIGMTSEWDMTPILLAAIFDALAAGPGLELPADPLQACDVVRRRSLPAPALDLHRLNGLLAPRYRPGQPYAELALALNASGDPAACPFPNLCGHPLLANLLASARELDGSLVARVFQNFVLGSLEYERAFGRPALFESPSLLATLDRPLLLPQTRARLLEGVRAGRLAAAVYTARASAMTGLSGLPYSPEAELAARLVGLEELPMVGYGQVCWLARQTGSPPDHFIKPSPVQALAAAGAALTGDIPAALRAAEALERAGQLDGIWPARPLELHVFEDSAGSVRAVRQAGQILSQAGRPTTVRAWGIAQNQAKREALLAAGAELFEDVNEALAQALPANSPTQQPARPQKPDLP